MTGQSSNNYLHGYLEFVREWDEFPSAHARRQLPVYHVVRPDRYRHRGNTQSSPTTISHQNAMPITRQQPGVSDMSGSQGNPLRTLLAGLKKVGNTTDNHPDQSHTSPQLQPVPQVLVANDSVRRQSVNPSQPQVNNPHLVPPHSVTNTNLPHFLGDGSEHPVRPPLPPLIRQNPNRNNDLCFVNDHGNMNHPISSQTLPSSSSLGHQQPNVIITNGPRPPTNVSQQSVPRPQFHPQALSSMHSNPIQTTQSSLPIHQQEAHRIRHVFNNHPGYQLPPQQLMQTQMPVNAKHQQLGTQQSEQLPSPALQRGFLPNSGVYFPNPPNNRAAQIRMPQVAGQLAGEISPARSRAFVPPINVQPALMQSQSQEMLPNKDNMVNRNLPPLQSNSGLLNQSDSFPFTTIHVQSLSNNQSNSPAHPRPSQKETTQPSSIQSGDTNNSSSMAGLKEGEKISRILNGFKSMLEYKPPDPVSSEKLPRPPVNDGNSGVGVVKSSDSDSSINIQDVSRMKANGNKIEIPAPTRTATTGCALVVKTEVIDIDDNDDDDDCVVTGLDLSKRIFVPKKQINGITIDLVDDEVQAADTTVKVEPNTNTPLSVGTATVVPINVVNAIDNSDDKNHVNDSNDTQLVTSSGSDLNCNNELEKGAAVSDKAVTSINDITEMQVENRVIESNKTVSSPATDSDVHNESLPNGDNSMNAPSSMQHIRSALGNILDSMKGNESMIPKARSSVELQSPVKKKLKSGEQRKSPNPESEDENDCSAANDRNDADTNEYSDHIVGSSSASGHHSRDEPSDNVNKLCSMTSELAVIDIASLCNKTIKSSAKNNDSPSSFQSIISASSEKDLDSNADEIYNSDSKVGRPVNRGRGFKRRRKTGSKRVVKRLKMNEEDGRNGYKQLRTPISDRYVPESSRNVEKLKKKMDENKAQNVENTVQNKSTEKTSMELRNCNKPSVALSTPNKQIAPIKHSMKKMDKKSGASTSESIPSDNDDVDDDDDDDDSDDDSDDADSISSDSCGSSLSDSSEDADVQYTCKLCNKSFNIRSHLKKHMKSHYKESEVKNVKKKVLCKGCRRKFPDPTALQAHLIQRRYCFFDCTRAYWKKKKVGSLKVCQMCGKGQAKWKDLKRHSYRDLTCRLRFINLVLERTKNNGKDLNQSTGSEKSGMVKTKGKEKMVEKNLKEPEELLSVSRRQSSSSEMSNQADRETSKKHCSSCGQDFDTRITFRQHLNKFDKCKAFYLNPQFKCPINLNYCPSCSIFMSSQSKLLTHKCNGKTNTVSCGVCLKVFNDYRGLKTHQRMTTCGMMSENRMVKTRKGNSGHNKIMCRNDNVSKWNTKSKPHNCDVCNDSFTQIQELLDHSHSHTEEGEYSCKDCDMQFTRYNRLVSHMICHKRKKEQENKVSEDNSGSKNFESSTTNSPANHEAIHQCFRCPLRFKSIFAYTVHQRVHKPKLPKKKDNKRLFKQNKRQQISSGSDDLKFSCSKCSQRFSTLSGRNHHLGACRDSQGQARKDKNDDTVSSTSNDDVGLAGWSEFHQCTLCPSIIRKGSFYNHLLDHKEDIIKSIKQNATQPLDAITQPVCTICDSVLLSNKNLLKHVQLHIPTDIIGSVQKSYKAPKRFPYNAIYKIPENSNATSINVGNQCSLDLNVSREEQSPTRRVVSQKIAHKNKPQRVSCKICPKTFQNAVTFKFHLKINHRNINRDEWEDYCRLIQASNRETGLDKESTEDSSTSCNKLISPVSLSMENSKSDEVSCEICQKVVKRRNWPRHMQDVHGLPRGVFIERARKLTGINIKKESEHINSPRIEVDMGGENIACSSSNKTLPPISSSCRSGAEQLCEASFSNHDPLSKHQLSHITQCSVALMKLEDIIKEVPCNDIGMESDSESGILLDEVDGAARDAEIVVDAIANDNDDIPQNIIDISLADEAAVSFDFGGDDSFILDKEDDFDIETGDRLKACDPNA